MKKSTVGLLVGVGAVLAWFFRGRILGETFVRPITLTMKNGRCGIEQDPERVELHYLRNDMLRWEISSPSITGCGGQHNVCIGNWRLNGVATDVPPVTNPRGLCRPVLQGNPPMRILAHINQHAPFGEYEYNILVDDVVVHDPIVKLTL
jgi:hypothetical protein